MKLRYFKIDPNTLVLLRQIGIGVLVISFFALLITGIWYGTRIESLTIATVEVEGGETINLEEVKTKVEQVLEGEYLGLVPRRFAWFYPESEIVSAVTATERIKNIVINRDSGTNLKVNFDEYTPQALWCKSVEQLECVYLDETGYAFGHTPQLIGGSFLRFVKTGEDPTIGTSVTNAQTLANISSLVEKLAEHEWFVSYVEIDQVDDIFLKIVEGGELKVTAAEDPAMTVDNLLVILSSEEFKHIHPGNFQYIDLRFGNKVFVNEQEKTATSSDEVAGAVVSTTTEEN